MTEHDTDLQLNGQADTDSAVSAIAVAQEPPSAPPEQADDVEFSETSVTPANDSASFSRLTPGAILFGALVSVGLIAFVLLARVTVHPFDQVDRNMRVIDVWRRLRHHLPDVAHPTLLGIVYDLSIALMVVGSLACIWLALMATNRPEPSKVTESADPSSPSDTSFLQSGR